MPDQKIETVSEKKNNSSKKRFPWITTGILFSACAISILIAAFTYAYFGFAKVNIAVNETVTYLATQTKKTQETIDSLQQTVTVLQNAENDAQALTKKQQELISNWQAAQKGNIDNWYIAEAQYLTRLANDHLQFMQNIPLAINLLSRAVYILQNVKTTDVVEIRKALATAITNLQAVPQVDQTSLYSQLNALNQQVDQLPLPPNPLTQNNSSSPSVDSPNLPWWKIGLNKTLEALGKIVIIRNNESDALPLVMPEAKSYIYQNMHAQLENAMWALLHRNGPIYQTSLARTMVWTHQYFDQSAPATKAMLQNLQDLIKVNVQPPAINLSHLIGLFDQYFAKANEAA